LAPAGRFGQGTHLHIPLSSRPLVSSHVELFWADGFYKTSVTCSMLFSGYDTCVRMSWVDIPKRISPTWNEPRNEQIHSVPQAFLGEVGINLSHVFLL
jgi:hypothetical protein